MKKLLPAFIIAATCTILFTSCKKDYHCSCTFNNTVKYTTDLGKQTKSDAKDQCSEYEHTIPGEDWNCDIN